jgi:hypothetical protein
MQEPDDGRALTLRMCRAGISRTGRPRVDQTWMHLWLKMRGNSQLLYLGDLSTDGLIESAASSWSDPCPPRLLYSLPTSSSRLPNDPINASTSSHLQIRWATYHGVSKPGRETAPGFSLRGRGAPQKRLLSPLLFPCSGGGGIAFCQPVQIDDEGSL